MRNRYLLGLLAYTSADDYGYMHLLEYAGTLCLFLNLDCRPSTDNGSLYLDSRIAYFDRFLFSS